MDNAFTSYRMEERSYVSYIKREIHQQVARTRFSETQAGEIDIIVSELSSNIIKHAGSGELLFRVHDDRTVDVAVLHDKARQILGRVDQGPRRAAPTSVDPRRAVPHGSAGARPEHAGVPLSRPPADAAHGRPYCDDCVYACDW